MSETEKCHLLLNDAENTKQVISSASTFIKPQTQAAVQTEQCMS